MSIDVRPIDDQDRWNELLTEVTHPTAFHHTAALDVFEAHSGATCHRLVGFKGEEPIGLFPLFTMEKGPVTTAFSPPPDLKVSYLGPRMIFRHDPKRRRRDKRNRRFVESALDWLEDHHGPRFTTIRTAPEYEDTRPFIWREFEATPRYTYVVDLEREPDELLSAFSSDARSNVTGDYDVDYEIGLGDVDDIGKILGQVRKRYAEQDESFTLETAVVEELYESLPEGVLRPYVCRIDGEFAGGILNVEYGDRAIRWIGGTKVDVGIPINDLLDWNYCRDAIGRGARSYDLAGANNARIASFKAKFAPDLLTYYTLQRGSVGMTALSKLYSKLR